MWKDVCGYEGYYEVSSFGDIRSVDRVITRKDGRSQRLFGKTMRFTVDKDGYLTTKLSKDGDTKTCKAHRIVARAFVPGFECGLDVNHKDLNKANNHCDNLEWVTRKENVRHLKSHGLHVSDSNLKGKNNPNYGNDTLKRRYESEPNLARLQSRPGGKNGRSIPIIATILGEKISFEYMSACAEYLIERGLVSTLSIEYLATIIRKHAESNKLYKGMKFEFHK